MKHLDVVSLVSCRAVNKSWNATASSILRKRPVWIKRKWDSDAFARLYKCVKRSTNFPFSKLDLSFTAKRSTTMDFCYAAKWFTKFGMIFTHLRADHWCERMQSTLLENAPNLKYLGLGRVERNRRPKFRLPSLRILSWEDCYEVNLRFIKEIISAAPQLEEIQHVYFSFAMMEALRTTDKLDLVSSIFMGIGDSNSAQICSQLAANPLLHLTALTVAIYDYAYRRCLTSIKAILVASQNSLKKLKFCNFTEQLADLPVFHKLEELDFEMEDRDVRKKRRKSAVLPVLSNALFPKLKKIRLDTSNHEITDYFIRDHFWEVCGIPLDTVDGLELGSYCDANAMRHLAAAFPRVTSVVVDYDKYSAHNLNDVWLLEMFPSLSRLNILNVPYQSGALDTILTGIPAETIAVLRAAPKQTLSPCVSQILRPHRCILNLRSNN